MNHVRNHLASVLALGAVALAACQDNVSPNTERGAAPSLSRTRTTGRATLVAINQALAARHAKFRAASASYITTGANGQIGQEIFFFDRGNKHIGVSFVPNDPRRHPGTNITYLVDRSDASPDGLAASQVVAAITRAMNTWEDVRCSNLSLDEVPDPGTDPDLFDGLIGFGSVGTPFADITHAGWYPAAFFDAVAPGGSEFILAVTIPFVFVDDDGNPTDIDNDHEADYAFAEIYYNDAFEWGINTPVPFDVQSVALHESGHGLGEAHFGKAFRTLANGKLHFAPRATMNAAYTNSAFGDLGMQNLRGTDIGGHCSIWASWPHR